MNLLEAEKVLKDYPVLCTNLIITENPHDIKDDENTYIYLSNNFDTLNATNTNTYIIRTKEELIQFLDFYVKNKDIFV